MEKVLPTSVMQWQFLTQFIAFLFILIGSLIISSPHFPNSEVSEQKNNDGFLALTIIGAILMLIGLYIGIKIFNGTR